MKVRKAIDKSIELELELKLKQNDELLEKESKRELLREIWFS